MSDQLTQAQALHALGLDSDVSPVQIERALAERSALLEQRVASAPTEALKVKYRSQLTELEQARGVLLGGHGASGLSDTMIADLPVAQVTYTKGASGPSTATGLSLKPGQALANRYQIEEQIGIGGMGAVYRAFDRNRDKDIAIKVLLPQLLSSPKARERFLSEARLASEMSHPNVVTVFDVQQDGPYTFLTMELLRGQTLRRHLDILREQRRQMTVDEVLRIADDVCRGLSYSHERTVHRDVKPENIWMTDDGRCKIMDFGIARLIETTESAQTNIALGTAYYMAPEQLARRGDIDQRADQYSVAVIVYEMLTGAVPTGRMESLRAARRNVPKALSNAVDRALAPKPEDRFRSMEEFRLALHGTGNIASALMMKWGAVVVALTSMIGAGIYFFPMIWSALPDRTSEASLRAQVASLQGESRAVLREIEAQKREIHDAGANAGRDVERLEGQLRSSRNADERTNLSLSLLIAKDKTNLATRIDQDFRAALEGPDGIAVQEGRLSEVDSLTKAGNLAAALSSVEAVKRSLMKLKGRPEQARALIDEARLKQASQIEGKWTESSCDDAASWVLKGDQLHVLWPASPPIEEKVVATLGEETWTIAISPAKYRGRLSSYRPKADQMTIYDHYSNRTAKLKKC